MLLSKLLGALLMMCLLEAGAVPSDPNEGGLPAAGVPADDPRWKEGPGKAGRPDDVKPDRLSKEERRKAQKARYAKARAKGTAGKGGFPGEPGAEPDDRMAHRPHHEEDPRNDDPVYRAEMKEKHRVAREKHKRERKIRDRHVPNECRPDLPESARRGHTSIGGDFPDTCHGCHSAHGLNDDGTKNYRGERCMLTCYCKGGTKSSTKTNCNMRTCPGDVANVGGKLVCVPPAGESSAGFTGVCSPGDHSEL